MNALTRQETDVLTFLDGVYPPESLHRVAGRAVANHLRMKLPDLDDTTIARVTLALSHIASGGADDTRVFGKQITCAALDLTAIERTDVPR